MSDDGRCAVLAGGQGIDVDGEFDRLPRRELSVRRTDERNPGCGNLQPPLRGVRAWVGERVDPVQCSRAEVVIGSDVPISRGAERERDGRVEASLAPVTDAFGTSSQEESSCDCRASNGAQRVATEAEPRESKVHWHPSRHFRDECAPSSRPVCR